MESPASLLLKCHMDLVPLTQRVESAKAREKELEEELGEMNLRIKVKEEELVETEEIQIEQKEKCESLQESCEEKPELRVLQHWASSEKREEHPLFPPSLSFPPLRIITSLTPPSLPPFLPPLLPPPLLRSLPFFPSTQD
ncbi:unnamed protein product [Pleuronectes platessa]|uniref:Uncharacterized protein n=1 Tax=Pleuronectes platessa TaxID=8262 RepID=A0A9N7YLB5_PLEPL|nr:unnamed protein product [Pleuronectes platessa]